MGPWPGYGCGCFITLLVIGVIWTSIFGRGFWLRMPWFGYGMPLYYVDTEMLPLDDCRPTRGEREEVVIPPPNVPPQVPHDTHFRDEALEQLIRDGKLREARKYLADMISVAREMKDWKCERDYAKYESEIRKAAMNPFLGRDKRKGAQ